MATKHNNPCAEKAADDEPIFTVRAHDVLAPKVVRMWAMMAEEEGTPPEKVAEARKVAEDMETWQGKNGSKVPD